MKRVTYSYSSLLPELRARIMCSAVHMNMQKTIVMSLYTMGRDRAYFADAEKFRPERWIRNADNKRHSVQEPHAFIPFGVGVRSCIGRRVAEMQMQFLLSRVSLGVHCSVSLCVVRVSRWRDYNYPPRYKTLNHTDLESAAPLLRLSLVHRLCKTFVSSRRRTKRWASSCE